MRRKNRSDKIIRVFSLASQIPISTKNNKKLKKKLHHPMITLLWIGDRKNHRVEKKES